MIRRRRNPDVDLRELERRAAAGGTEDKLAYARARRRAGQPVQPWELEPLSYVFLAALGMGPDGRVEALAERAMPWRGRGEWTPEDHHRFYVMEFPYPVTCPDPRRWYSGMTVPPGPIWENPSLNSGAVDWWVERGAIEVRRVGGVLPRGGWPEPEMEQQANRTVLVAAHRWTQAVVGRTYPGAFGNAVRQTILPGEYLDARIMSRKGRRWKNPEGYPSFRERLSRLEIPDPDAPVRPSPKPRPRRSSQAALRVRQVAQESKERQRWERRDDWGDLVYSTDRRERGGLIRRGLAEGIVPPDMVAIYTTWTPFFWERVYGVHPDEIQGLSNAAMSSLNSLPALEMIEALAFSWNVSRAKARRIVLEAHRAKRLPRGSGTAWKRGRERWERMVQASLEDPEAWEDNPDPDLRDLERRAAQGDLEAADKLHYALVRTGRPRDYSDEVERWLRSTNDYWDDLEDGVEVLELTGRFVGVQGYGQGASRAVWVHTFDRPEDLARHARDSCTEEYWAFWHAYDALLDEELDVKFGARVSRPDGGVLVEQRWNPDARIRELERAAALGGEEARRALARARQRAGQKFTREGVLLGDWKEVTEEDYWYGLEAVPPQRMWGSGHLVGELYSSTDEDENVWVAFAEHGGRYYKALVTEEDLGGYLGDLRRAREA